MNFQHYFAQLQTPAFSFYEFDSQYVVKQYLEEIREYLITKKVLETELRRVLVILVELLQQTTIAKNIGMVHLYKLGNTHVVYAKIDFVEKYMLYQDYLISTIEEIQNMHKVDFRKYDNRVLLASADKVKEEINHTYKFGWVDIKRKSNEAYFQLAPPTAPNFTLEIIATVNYRV